MRKIITGEQIQAILGTIYSTNISAKDYDLVKVFFAKLEDVDKKPEQTSGRD